MQAFRVIGRGFNVGAGALLLLSTAQSVARQHKLEPIEGGGRVSDGFGLARAKETQAFKVGELLGLTEPPKGQMGLVEELEAPKGKRDRDDPVVGLLNAVRVLEERAERAEMEREAAAARAEAQRLAQERADAAAAQQRAWSEEWAANEAIKAKYPKLDDYLAARQKEAAAQQK
ncbi:hypothetical protein [Bradyrhizobium sp. DOA9]|uniref:hypothetical protein n=1 Tax=Bradyrhizobium sp. DOA9 TaxID=1126627 RepID=UPI00046AB320|nr:hypothetical protein [Bradyrhizobium sp. DOA9]GAJ35163.1 hypothetical protein BDOA9_0143620 [Bradyrhizobium sp. DOA9]